MIGGQTTHAFMKDPCCFSFFGDGYFMLM